MQGHDLRCIDVLTFSPTSITLQIERGDLGNPPAMQIMEELKPKYWFSAHHHVKYAALVPHKGDDSKPQDKGKTTNFLALDKCLPGRRFLQVYIPQIEINAKEFALASGLVSKNKW